VLSTTIDLKSPSKKAPTEEVQQLNAEMTARMLYVAVKWVKTLPSFTMLSSSDQMTLLMHSWSDLFVLSAFQWSMSMDKCPLFDDGDNVEVLRPMMQLFERFKQYRLDQGELTCLKAIALFRPELDNLHNQDQVEKFQDQAQIMLHQHVNRIQPNPVKFGRILLLIPMIKDACPVKVIEQVFLQPALGNKSIQDVIADIHKN
jgi:hypothetical protein